MEGDFHRYYQVPALLAELKHRTWRWFAVRVSSLPAGSAWSHALYPPNPATGARTRSEPVTTIDDPDAVDAFFARQAG